VRPIRDISRIGLPLVWLVVGLGLAAGQRAAWGVDAFEIQVYDGTANDPGVPGLELHFNDVAEGRTSAPPPELPSNHQAHLTFEPSLGVTRSWELGAYLQTALRPDGQFDLAGFKLRSKLVTPPGWRPQLRLGCNLEVSWVPATYEPNRWGAEIRPIVAWESHRWLLAANPIVELSFNGAAPALAPALMGLLKLGVVFSAGLEYYADFGPLTAPLPARAQEHYLFEVVNLAFPDFDLEAGFGEGLTGGSNDLVAKLILGFRFDRRARVDAVRISDRGNTF
jgi:hypothetical protein